MKSILSIVLFVTALLSASPIPESQLDKYTTESAKASANQKWCGTYQSKGLVDKLTFSGRDNVVLSVSGLEVERKWHVLDGNTIILTDKEEWKFVPVGKDALRGVQGIVEKQVFKLVKKPALPCAPYEADHKALRNRLCYLSAVAERSAMRHQSAKEWYEWCCQLEDAQSCNALGFYAALQERNPEKADKYYKKACDMGFGGGCSNLADEAYRKKQYDSAIALYKKGCSLGHKDACFKTTMDMMKTMNEPL